MGSRDPEDWHRVRMILHPGGHYRIVLDGQEVGPLCTERAAKGVRRWLEAALPDLERPSGSKLERTLGAVDGAVDAVTDLLKNGFR